MARCTRSAATDESTPPEMPQTTFAPPTRLLISLMAVSIKDSIVQAGSSLQTLKRKFSMMVRPAGVWATSG